MLAEKLSGAVGNAANPTYIEDVFSTYLYTGVSQPGSSSSYGWLTNNIDLLGKGGMIWTKDRSNNATGTNDNVIVDTLRGTGSWPAYSNSPYMLKTNTTAAQALMSDAINGVNNTGYYIGPGNTGVDAINTLNNNYVSWTFRKQPKFFDVVTYTGNGNSGPRTITHSLGSTPGCIIVKSTTGAYDWAVYHRSLGATKGLYLNSTQAEQVNNTLWNDTAPTSTSFTVGASGGSSSSTNANGETYVAYIFAHNAGGFGLTGTDNVISCGSVTLGAGVTTINLGYEPQWILFKSATSAQNWQMVDSMRGLSQTGYQRLFPNTSGAEGTVTSPYIVQTSTGFTMDGSNFGSGDTFIYIAIRRGPMKVPTDGTKVFKPITAVSGTQTTNFPVDMQILSLRDGASALLNHQTIDRLRGVSSTSTAQGNYLNTTSTAAEDNTNPYSSILMSNVGFQVGNNYAGGNGVFHSFQRAPSFFDVVCYTGTGVSSVQNVSHNLSVVPTLMIVKGTNATSASQWRVYDVFDGADNYMALNTTAATASGYGAYWGNSTTPTSSVFSVSSSNNQSGGTYVAYLFATCAGVSKVFSFTGNGSTQTINCGFAGGARFVLLKATSTTGGWYVYDTARGMTTLTDPYLFLNSTAAESATLGSVTTVTTGFAVNESVLAGVNTNGVSYIGLAIA